MVPPESKLHSGEIEVLFRDHGFHKVAWLSTDGLPRRLAEHPEITALGEGTFLLAALSTRLGRAAIWALACAACAVRVRSVIALFIVQ